MTSSFRKLGWLVRRRRKEDELQFHLDKEAEERQVEGLANDQAKWAARRDLGNITLVKENTRAMWSWAFFEQVVQDLRYALRMMVNNRAFTALAVLSLALGIGANTAIFSFMDSILLRVLPVPDPTSLAVLNWHSKLPEKGPDENARTFVMHAMDGSTYEDTKGVTSGIFPFPAFELFRKNSGSVFSSVFAYYPTGSLNVVVTRHADLAKGVSGDYFSRPRRHPCRRPFDGFR
jgi:macrolide transport system ATP-binding/permease protein